MFCLQKERYGCVTGKLFSIVSILSHGQVEEAAVRIPADGGASLSLSLSLV